ncbi:dual specificity protein phosphatase Mpk3-like [Anneissia japonica]|uniref:dual specificity protein phosphatase Mpk3-like n=1 Tax=Anneissia japonica TaxID=1529436 RepID=UPI0014256A9C|nr:dual specificity protein phosphatase Mpk3-like [Anneissia japonica]
MPLLRSTQMTDYRMADKLHFQHSNCRSIKRKVDSDPGMSLLQAPSKRISSSCSDLSKFNKIKHQPLNQPEDIHPHRRLNFFSRYQSGGMGTTRVRVKPTRTLTFPNSDTNTSDTAKVIPTIQIYHLKCYQEQHISQILDFLFVGDIKSAYNESLLCRHRITSLIDMSNSMTDVTKPMNPCVCKSGTPHTFVRLRLRVTEKILEKEYPLYFSEINTFIEKARQANLKVLVHSLHGQSRSPTGVIQYLMQYQRMSMASAYDVVKKAYPKTKLTPVLYKILQNIERHIVTSDKHNFRYLGTESSMTQVWT